MSIRSKGEKMQEIKKDLQRIVDYLYEDEFTHYIEENKPDDHIFLAVNNVEKYLNLKQRRDNE
tara:strand:+ start:69 stop:257 length:189 start_codon:yes stop_codon:yes gene_type:complete